MGPVLTDPWYVPDMQWAEGFEQEAADEIGPGHPLGGHILTLIALCMACDSAAFRVDDGSFAIIHLTWAQHPEPPPWPMTEICTGYHALEAAADQHGAGH